MPLRVEQECPQCAAPLVMEETDRLLRCKFCNVQSFLVNSDPLHFILPRREPDPYTIYVPYHRFKGAVYSCLDLGIEHHLADISTCGVELSFLPSSLGLRPQAMKMRFATPELPGTFLRSTIKPEMIIKRAAKEPRFRNAKILHQAIVGDVVNTIYLPISIKNEQIYDGIIDTPLAEISENATPFADTEIDSKTWKPEFRPALCPQCGWNLAGESDSVVLICGNCNTAWQAVDNNFSSVKVTATPSSDENVIYLPFWNFGIAAGGIKLDSYADFIRITNQPLVVTPEWGDMALQFIIPAFKVRPLDFLRLGSRMTVCGRHKLSADDKIPRRSLYPVTLRHDDAARSLKAVLAESAVSRKHLFPLLPEITLKATGQYLHYLPFARTTHELQQPSLGVTINQRVLSYGRAL